MGRKSLSLVPGPRDPKRNSTLGLVCGAIRRRIVGERAEPAQHGSPPPIPRSTTPIAGLYGYVGVPRRFGLLAGASVGRLMY